jgi:Family of unknown function (DUF6760)
LLQEVFFLAYHLHWSRDAILGLPVPERGRYVELLQDQLRQEEQAVRAASKA